MLQRWKDTKRRNARIKELQQYIDKTFEHELKDVKTEQENFEAHQRIFALVKYEHNELENLRQHLLQNRLRRSPIEVPEEYWNPCDRDERRTLTYKGEVWARRELKKLLMADIEFWFKLVVPLLALILSIIALVKRSH
jgi:hypothetical protein